MMTAEHGYALGLEFRVWAFRVDLLKGLRV